MLSKKRLHPIHFIACGFGIGFLPWMPGTWATLAAVPLTLYLASLPWWLYLLALILLNGVGIYLCGKTNRDWGEHDHPAVVWDELAAFPITLFALPSSWPYVLAAVILFRFFDIAKPGVIGHIDRHWHGGVGVMLDDMIAAVLTWVILATAHVVILFSS